MCIDYDVCKCDKEWTGKDCTQFSCGFLDHCSGKSPFLPLYSPISQATVKLDVRLIGDF